MEQIYNDFLTAHCDVKEVHITDPQSLHIEIF